MRNPNVALNEDMIASTKFELGSLLSGKAQYLWLGDGIAFILENGFSEKCYTIQNHAKPRTPKWNHSKPPQNDFLSVPQLSICSMPALSQYTQASVKGCTQGTEGSYRYITPTTNCS